MSTPLLAGLLAEMGIISAEYTSDPLLMRKIALLAKRLALTAATFEAPTDKSRGKDEDASAG